ncbi:MAG: hypothetical protein RR982_05375, partial [Kiritimatiellia bacterium]
IVRNYCMNRCALFTLLLAVVLTGCSSLTRQERVQLQQLKSVGITIDRPLGCFEPPNSILTASLLNIGPGIGNFYLASGESGESRQVLYGILNFFLWPLSCCWAIPGAAIDAETINQREMAYYYFYTKMGAKELKKENINFEE